MAGGVYLPGIELEFFSRGLHMQNPKAQGSKSSATEMCACVQCVWEVCGKIKGEGE